LTPRESAWYARSMSALGRTAVSLLGVLLATTTWAGPARAAGSAVTGSDLRAATPPPFTAVPAKEVAQRYGQYPDDALKKIPQIKAALRRLDPSFLETVTDPNGQEVLITGPGADNRAARLGSREVLLVSSCKRASLCDTTWFVLAYDVQSSAVALLTETDQPHRFVLFGSPEPAVRALLFSTAAQDMDEAGQGPAPPPAAAACPPPFPGQPAPGKYVRVKAPKWVLTIASGCTTPSTLADPKGNVQDQGVLSNEADQQSGLPAAAFLPELSVCAGHVLKQTNPGTVHVTWAVELTGSGRKDCGGEASIEGDYARVP
jgi:hypothetical protein